MCDLRLVFQFHYIIVYPCATQSCHYLRVTKHANIQEIVLKLAEAINQFEEASLCNIIVHCCYSRYDIFTLTQAMKIQTILIVSFVTLA